MDKPGSSDDKTNTRTADGAVETTQRRAVETKQDTGVETTLDNTFETKLDAIQITQRRPAETKLERGAETTLDNTFETKLDAIQITQRRAKTGGDAPLDPLALLGGDAGQARTHRRRRRSPRSARNRRRPRVAPRRARRRSMRACAFGRRYVLERLLGSGGMGQVWKAKDLVSEQARDPNPFVAIKLLNADFEADPDAFVSLQRETKKAQELAHPNVITVFAFDTDDDGSGRAFMSMELLDGETMDGLRSSASHAAEMTCVLAAGPLIIGMAKGLEYAHKKGNRAFGLQAGECLCHQERRAARFWISASRAQRKSPASSGWKIPSTPEPWAA